LASAHPTGIAFGFQNDTQVLELHESFGMAHSFSSEAIPPGSGITSRFEIAYEFQNGLQTSELHSRFRIAYRLQNYMQVSEMHTGFRIAYRFQNCLQISELHSDFEEAYKVRNYI
jgi:hypothetical protein